MEKIDKNVARPIFLPGFSLHVGQTRMSEPNATQHMSGARLNESATFRPEAAILELDERFRSAVDAADFPEYRLRWRNQRWAAKVGLGALSDEQWISHFGKFEPLAGSLSQPQALAYHGDQFGVYNPDIGDGRGFLHAQLRDAEGRLLDLGTKGSGRTPWSRTGDGRLTLKGGVREVLAANMLEALGVYTSKPFSLIETGEELYRGDEPSPTRSSVLVRLSHSHIRFGTFQRHAHHQDADAIAELVGYCVRHYHPAAEAGDTATTAVALFEKIVAQTARLAASWMAAGFVHGVLNTDNMVVTGESFDYGPWRFLPHFEPDFVAAYFDEGGRYRFGQQPAAALWNLARLGSALALVCEVAPLQEKLSQFEDSYRSGFARHVLRLLGLETVDDQADEAFVTVFMSWMRQSQAPWPQVFFDWFCGEASVGRAAASPAASFYESNIFAPVRKGLTARRPVCPERLESPYFARKKPVSLLIEEVEAVWAPITAEDDWTGFERLLGDIRTAGDSLRIAQSDI